MRTTGLGLPLARPLLAFAVLGLVLAAALPVQAASGTVGVVRVDSATIHGDLEADGIGLMGWVMGSDGIEPALALQIDAAHMMSSLTSRGYYAVVPPHDPDAEPNLIADDQNDNSRPDVVTTEASDVSILLDDHQSEFRLHVLPLVPTKGFEMGIESGSSSLSSIAKPSMDGCGIQGSSETRCIDTRYEVYFDDVPSSRAVVRMDTSSGLSQVHIQGDVVLEMYGIRLVAESANGQIPLDAQAERTPLQTPAGPLPAGTDAYAYHVEVRFLRLELTDADIRFASNGLASEDSGAHWAFAHAEASSAGVVMLDNATGEIHDDGIRASLTADPYIFEGLYSLTLLPNGDALHMTATPATPEDVGGGTILPVDVASPNGILVVLGLLVVTALAVVAVRVARLRISVPTLASIERALEGSKYRRAAAMAKRILDKDPNVEDALLSRAIALQKGGRAKVVVSELQVQLQAKEPSDGVLHYVLGLACIDLGRRDEARVAFSEAVQRTPSLLEDARHFFPGLAEARPKPAAPTGRKNKTLPDGYA